MSRPNVVIGHRVFDETLDLLRPVAHVTSPVSEESLDAAQLRAALASADAWMAFMPDSADAQLLAGCSRLRLIAGALKGCDNFDIAACTRRGVWVSVVPDLLTVPTAELIIALMIGLARHVLAGDRLVRSGGYRGWRPMLYGAGLAGARVGFVGMGVIGQAVARRLVAFEVAQRYFDPLGADPALERELRLGRERHLDGLLEWSDYLVLAAPLTSTTLHLIDSEALARIRPGCLLINAARGSLVDESAVLAALNAGRLGGYAADVFELEDWARTDRPRDIAAGLRAHPATLFTPHLGSAVVSVRRGIERRAAQNILDFIAGRPPRDAVNPEARRDTSP